MFLVLTILISLIGFYILIKKWPKSGKIGIHLGGTKCSECGYDLPKIRKPKNINQILWGGWTCPNCGCEVDKYGKGKNTNHVASSDD